MPNPTTDDAVMSTLAEEDGITNWARHMDPNTTITVRPKTKIIVLNVCLGASIKDIHERSSFLVKIKEKGSFYCVCSFLPGRIESHFCNLTLFPGKEYQLKLCGENPVDLLGIEYVYVANDAREHSGDSRFETEDEEQELEESAEPKGKEESSPKKTRSRQSKGKAPANAPEQAPVDEKGRKPRGPGRPKKSELGTGKGAGSSKK